MVLCGEGRTVNLHIKAQAQPVSSLRRIWFQLFFYSGPFRITGNFCGANLQFMRTMCFPQKSAKHPKIFLLSIQVCVCVRARTWAQAHVLVRVCVFESEKNLCALCGSFSFDHVPGSPPWHPAHPMDTVKGRFPGGLQPSAPNSF